MTTDGSVSESLFDSCSLYFVLLLARKEGGQGEGRRRLEFLTVPSLFLNLLISFALPDSSSRWLATSHLSDKNTDPQKATMVSILWAFPAPSPTSPSPRVDTNMSSMREERSVGIREGKPLALGHTASKW